MRNIIYLLCAYVIGCSFIPGDIRHNVQQTYTHYIGLREATGHNDGPEIETMLHYVSRKKGDAWCAAFVCWTYGQCGVINPRAGWAPAMFPATKVIYTRGQQPKKLPEAGDVMGIYFPELKRIAHVGFIDQWETSNKNIVITVEGNTNDNGSREGNGVYRKRRLKRQIYKVARWIND